jgi:hypothetical protein
LIGNAVQYLIQRQTVPIQQMTGWHRGIYFLPAVTMGIALLAGQKFRRFQSPEEIYRPTTLFGKQ